MSREMNENGRVSFLAVAFLVVVLAIGFVLAGAVEAGENPSPDVILDEQGRVIAMRPDPAMVAAPADNAQLQKHSVTVTPTLMNDNLVVRDWTDDPIPMELPFKPDRVVWEDATNSANPRMAADPNTGMIWVAFTHYNGADDDVFLANSSDLGLTWNWFLNTNGAFNERNPSIALSDNTIMIWYEQDEGGSEQNMNFLMSQDSGVSWGGYFMDWSWTNDPGRERQEDIRNVQVSSKKAATWWVAADTYHPALATGNVVFMRTEDETSWSMWYYMIAGYHENVDWQRPDIMANSANDDMNIAWEIENITEGGYDIQWVIYDSGMTGVAAWWTAMIDGGNTDIYPEFGIRDDYAYLVWQNGTSPADITAFYSDDGGHSTLWILFVTRENGYDEHSPSVYVDGNFMPHISCWNESRISYLNNSNVPVDPFAIISADDFPGAAADVFRSSDVIEFANSPRIVWTDDRNFTLGIYYTDLGISKVTYTIERSPAIAIGDLLVDGAPCPGTCQYLWDVASSHTLEAPLYMDDLSPNARFIFDSWSDGGAQNHTIQVGASDMTITAYYDPQYNITIETLPDPNLEVVIDWIPYTAPQSFWWTLGEVHTLDVTTPQTIDGTSRYAWDSWSDGGGQSHPVTITMVNTYIATFGIEYMVNVTTFPTPLDVEVDGVPGASPLSFWWLDGSVHDLYAISPQTVSPDEQWAWVDWSDAEAQAHQITVIGPETFTANYISQYNISFTTSPAGLLVEVDGVPYDTSLGPVYFFWNVGSVHTIFAPSPQPINPTSQYTWQFWNDMGNQTHDITVTGPATYTANFGVQFKIDVNANVLGLDISVDAVEHTAPYSFWCPQGSSVMLGAPSPQDQTPTMRYRWDSWSDSGTQSHPIICNMASAYTANFVAQYLLNVSSDPQGLLVEIDGFQGPGPQLAWFDTGTIVTINAPSPQLSGDTRAVYSHWNDGQPQSHQVTVTGPATYVAYFDTEFRMTVTSTPVTGLDIEVMGLPQVTEHQFWCNAGLLVNINAVSPQYDPLGTSRYVWLSWSDGGGQSHTVTCDGPNTYTANFVLEHEVTITSSPAGRQVIVDTVTQGTPYVAWWAAGEVHNIDVQSPQPGVPPTTTQFVWTSWSDAGAQNHNITVTEPDTVVAFFTKQYKITITTNPAGLEILADMVAHTTPYEVWWDESSSHWIDVSDPQIVAPGERYMWASWSDAGLQNHNIVVAVSQTYTATMDHEFEATIDSAPVMGITVTIDGLQYTTSYSFWCGEGNIVSISAVDIHSVGSGVQYEFASWSDGGLRTHNIQCDTPKTLTATYTTQYYLTVVSTYGNPQGEGWYNAGTSADFSVTSPDPGATGVQYVLSAWTGDSTATTPSAQITMDGPKTVTAQWTTQFYLTVVSDYGTATGEGWHDSGTSPTAGLDVDTYTVGTTQYVFLQWTGDASGTDHTQSSAIVMDAPKTVTAQWTTQYYLTVTSTYGDPQGEDWYDAGTSADFSVTSPDPGATGVQYVLSAWTGDSTATTPSAQITMDGPKTVTAQWTTQYYLTVVSTYGTATGEGWHNAATSANAGITGLTDCADVDTAGTTRQLFDGWTSDATGSSCTQSTGILMNAPKTATAAFKTQYFLTVVSDKGTPTGQGWHDAGTQATFSVTSPVTVDGVEYAFTGWSGDSTDSGKSSEVLMDAAKTVEAKWEESGFLAKFWWIFPIIIIIIIAAILAIWMMKRKKPEEEELPPPEEMEIPPEEEEV